jgi:hypothetical protein
MISKDERKPAECKILAGDKYRNFRQKLFAEIYVQIYYFWIIFIQVATGRKSYWEGWGEGGGVGGVLVYRTILFS